MVVYGRPLGLLNDRCTLTSNAVRLTLLTVAFAGCGGNNGDEDGLRICQGSELSFASEMDCDEAHELGRELPVPDWDPRPER